MKFLKNKFSYIFLPIFSATPLALLACHVEKNENVVSQQEISETIDYVKRQFAFVDNIKLNQEENEDVKKEIEAKMDDNIVKEIANALIIDSLTFNRSSSSIKVDINLFYGKQILDEKVQIKFASFDISSKTPAEGAKTILSKEFKLTKPPILEDENGDPVTPLIYNQTFKNIEIDLSEFSDPKKIILYPLSISYVNPDIKMNDYFFAFSKNYIFNNPSIFSNSGDQEHFQQKRFDALTFNNVQISKNSNYGEIQNNDNNTQVFFPFEITPAKKFENNTLVFYATMKLKYQDNNSKTLHTITKSFTKSLNSDQPQKQFNVYFSIPKQTIVNNEQQETWTLKNVEVLSSGLYGNFENFDNSKFYFNYFFNESTKK